VTFKIKHNGELHAFQKTIESLGRIDVRGKDPTTLRGILTGATKMIAETAQRTVKKGYTANTGASYSRGTLLTYKHGKHPGQQWSFRRPYPGASPGRRSGAIANSLRTVPLTGATFIGHQVEVDPGKLYTGFAGKGDDTDRGKPLWWVASQLENPRPAVISIPKTRRMQVYLMLLYRGEAGVGSPEPRKHLLNYMTGGVIVTHRRPLKIWETAFRDLVRRIPQVLPNKVRIDIDRVVAVSRRNTRFLKPSWYASK
jgi:hypothetical protein